MSDTNLSPPPTQVEDFNSIWRTWIYLLYKKVTKRTFPIYLLMSAALSPSIDPMADGLIGLVPVALADDSKDESRNIALHVPLNWIPGSDMTLHIHLINTVNQTGVTTVITELSYISVGDGEYCGGTGVTLSNTYSLPSGVSAETLHEGSIFTIPGSAMALDDKIFLKILRKGTTDTAVGDIGYDGIHIEYSGYINHE